ncbi:ABC transporter ATP-binding protein [Actinomyces procaprae]|uniref:ABC transporter ATP-binding protein n=1 Tax=Actinomyces procaprae TaxID=2560010 RepID=UPI0014471DB7|nr:ABC transporter ATP-binding protein [Actinomyces procaprae]
MSKHEDSVIRLVVSSAPAHLVTLAVLTIIMSSIPGVQITVVKTVVDAVAYSADRTLLFEALALFCGLLTFGVISQCVLDYIGTRLSIRLREHISLRTVEIASLLEVEQLEDPAVFDKVHRASGDVSARIYDMVSGIRAGIQALLSVIGVGAVIVSWNVKIAVLIMVAAVPSGLATIGIAKAKYALDYKRAQDARKASYIRSLFFDVPAVREMKVFGTSRRLLEDYRCLMVLFAKQDTRLARHALVITLICGLLSVTASCGAIVIAAFEAIVESKVGEFAGFVSAVSSMTASVQAVISSFSSAFQSGLFLVNWREFTGLVRRISLLDDSDMQGRSAEFDFESAPQIRFRNVWFRYPSSSTDVLEDVSFDVPSGKTTAIVGVSGSGKSTLIKLMLKFYTVKRGRIYFDDLSLDDIRRNHLYDVSSVLFQDYMMYEFSLRENVGFGQLALIDDDFALARAMTKAGVCGVGSVNGIGLDDTLGRLFDGGVQLSTGQWQRVALARAFLKSPRLLVLDEPTSSLDPQSERQIFRELSSHGDDVTVILISHRPSTIACADHVVFLDNGRVVDEGSHDELLERCEGYRAVFGAH